MGVPARKIESDVVRTSRTRPRLAAVKTKTPVRARQCDPTTVSRRNFRAFAVLTVVMCALGLGRVWLSVQAADASLDAGRLRSSIKTERYRGDMLEVQQSALSSPSRIRGIAGATMNMAPAGEVTYIELEPSTALHESAPEREGASVLDRAIGDVLALAAGEAQVLLVGDVGLASAR